MASELLIGFTFGVTVASGLQGALFTANAIVEQLGRATEGLITKQRLMARQLSQALAQGGNEVERLRVQYEGVGHSVDQLRHKQVLLNACIFRGAQAQRLRQLEGSQSTEAFPTDAALDVSLKQAFRSAVDFREQTRDIAITAGLTAAQELQLGGALRDAALSGNQPSAEVAKGTAVLAKGGITDP